MTRARWKLKRDRSPQRTKIVTVRSPRSRAPLPGETASPTDHWIRPAMGLTEPNDRHAEHGPQQSMGERCSSHPAIAHRGVGHL